MATVVDFQLLSIDVLDYYIPKNTLPRDVPEVDNCLWDFTYSFRFDTYSKTHDLVVVTMSFDLFKNDADDDDEPVMYVEIRNRFKVTSGIQKTTKATILESFFHITACNIQGIFAAKLEKTLMAHIIPPPVNRDKYAQQILEILENEQ